MGTTGRAILWRAAFLIELSLRRDGVKAFFTRSTALLALYSLQTQIAEVALDVPLVSAPPPPAGPADPRGVQVRQHDAGPII